MASSARVRLLPATLRHLEAFRESPEAFESLLGVPAPDGWPEFPEAIDFTIAHLVHSGMSSDPWGMHLFLHGGTGALIGSGGYAGPPTDRTVEIGYEIAPAYRGLGLGRESARALVDTALATGEVDHVIAHTLPGPNPSTGVLRSLGFAKTGELDDPEEGTVWEWRLRGTGTAV